MFCSYIDIMNMYSENVPEHTEISETGWSTEDGMGVQWIMFLKWGEHYDWLLPSAMFKEQTKEFTRKVKEQKSNNQDITFFMGQLGGLHT